MLTEDTEYDEYVNQKTGQIKLSKVCKVLSMMVWGLIMAKAKASFTFTDIFDGQERQKKQNKIFYICVMIALAQLIKSCAENNYAETFINQIEHQLDTKVFNISTEANETTTKLNASNGQSHHGPLVQATKNEDVNIDEIIS